MRSTASNTTTRIVAAKVQQNRNWPKAEEHPVTVCIDNRRCYQMMSILTTVSTGGSTAVRPDVECASLRSEKSHLLVLGRAALCIEQITMESPQVLHVCRVRKSPSPIDSSTSLQSGHSIAFRDR